MDIDPTPDYHDDSPGQTIWQRLAKPRFLVAAACILVLFSWLVPKVLDPLAMKLFEGGARGTAVNLMAVVTMITQDI